MFLARFICLALFIEVQFSLVQTQYSMIITWGQPTNTTNVTTITTSSWDSCVDLCFSNQACVMAHGSDFCHHYQFSTVYEAQQLTSDSGSKIAVKSTQDPTICPSLPRVNVTEEMGFTNSSYLYTTFNYTTFFDGSNWSFNYSVNVGCPLRWNMVQRSIGNYCLFVYLNFKTYYAYSNATTACASNYKGVIEGFETDEERQWALGVALNHIMNETETTTIGIWVAGQRKSTCNSTTLVNAPQCQGTNAFNFPKTTLTTKAGYLWAPGQPSSLVNGQMQDCIMFWAQKPENATAVQGTVDDGTCIYTHDTFASRRGYLCGKMPGV